MTTTATDDRQLMITVSLQHTPNVSLPPPSPKKKANDQNCSLSVNVSLTARSDLNKLFDGDITSCVVTTSLFTRRDVYTAGLFVTSVNGTSENDKIALNVKFENDVECPKRKVDFFQSFVYFLKYIQS